ncbi:MAG TPA: hypothetical protein VFQ35_14780 [Polyangiaceae bacterium]|nr:hypothetical protein [Polyangiaceae bacterium]
MANRHTHKKLRAEVRARMTATGESHQTALAHILARGQADPAVPDLIAVNYFGVTINVAVFEVLAHLRVVLVSGSGVPLGLPLGSALPLRVHTDGVQ